MEVPLLLEAEVVAAAEQIGSMTFRASVTSTLDLYVARIGTIPSNGWTKSYWTRRNLNLRSGWWTKRMMTTKRTMTRMNEKNGK